LRVQRYNKKMTYANFGGRFVENNGKKLHAPDKISANG